MTTKHPKRLITCTLAVIMIMASIVLSCPVLFVAGAVLRNRFCYVNPASRIGVYTTNSSDAYDAIIDYLNDNLKNGASEEEVVAVLSKISEVRVTQRQIKCEYPTARCLPVTVVIMDINFKGCGNIRVELVYKVADGTLYKFTAPRRNWD